MAGALDWPRLGLVHADLSRIISPLCRRNYEIGSSNTGVPAAKVDMVPAGIEPELFDHPAAGKVSREIPARTVARSSCILACSNAFQRVDYLLASFRGRFARKAGCAASDR